MISSAIIPQPLARLPWRLIFLIFCIAGIGILTLYSAAGGSVQPWALISRKRQVLSPADPQSAISQSSISLVLKFAQAASVNTVR